MGRTASPTGALALRCCCLWLLLPFFVSGETCQKVKLTVPSHIHHGALIGKVNLKDCVNSDDVHVQSSNPDFVVLDDGSVYTMKSISVSTNKVFFSILITDFSTKTVHKIPVKFVMKHKTAKSRRAREVILRRTKRMWRPMPFSIQENSLCPLPCFLQQIQSDTQENYTITYTITGEGVNEPPYDLFRIDGPTGNIYITRRVDREVRASYKLMGFAISNDGYSPEKPLPIEIKVEDDNDNAPQFTEETFCAEVYEHSRTGSVVGRVNATDRDEPNSMHTRLRYTLLAQIPTSPVMFAIHPDFGIITTTSDRLDRETLDTYKLLVEVRDMGGQPYGLSSTGTVVVTILDINDHQPTFTATSYQTEVNENESGMVIFRIPIRDADQANTPNWRVVYTLTRGNENGNFNISTDPNTNEGLLSVIKGLNYEETPKIVLEVGVANEGSFRTTSGTKSVGLNTVPVTVIVKNVDEGPEFQPIIKVIRTKENQTIGTVIGQCQAIDPETKTSAGIRYKKLTDVYSWVNIDENTCQITTLKVLDYESNEAPTHQYNVTVLSTDQSGKTGTGTIVINLEDVNDNTPSIIRSDTTVCQLGRKYSEIVVDDPDGLPNSGPFTFNLDTNNDPSLTNKWRVIKIDDHTARLEEISDLPLGTYSVPLSIADRQGQARTQIVTINKCSCPDSLNCGSRATGNNTALGGLAILLMVLSALLLALLLCLLLTCLCGAAAGKDRLGFPDDSTQQNLIVTNTEAPGADVMDPNFKVPVHITNPNRSGNAPSNSSAQGHGGRSVSQIDGGQQITYTKTGQLTSEMGRGQFDTMRRDQMLDSHKQTYSEWQSFMNTHLGDKLYMCGQHEQHQNGEDYVLPYNYEGKGSLAGSVGCCSELKGDEERLDFLNQLEPKFRTLAEVCAKK